MPAKSPFPNINNKELTDEKIMKAIKQMTNKKAFLDIETESLNITCFILKFNNNIFYFMKQVVNQKCDTKRLVFIMQRL